MEENGKDITRLGIKVSKKIGGSVKRNRLKRFIREFFRLNKKRLPKGYDIMIIPSKESDRLTFLNVENELGGLLFKNYDLVS